MTKPRYKWQPSTAEIAEAAGIPPGEVERFDHNTSPIAADWAVDIAAAAARSANEYPAASYAVLREAAGRYRDVPPDRIAVGAGADELILLAARAFMAPGSTAVIVPPTYPLYAIATAQVGAAIVDVPSHPPQFPAPKSEILSAASEADVVWLCLPNNPTGTHPGQDFVREAAAAARGVVVVDAAYAEFSGETWSGPTNTVRNLLAIHTLSKAFGLAGARVGYAVGHPDLVDAIDAVRPPGSISSIAVDLGVAALGNPERMRDAVAELTISRDQLAHGLANLGLRVLSAPTNFVLAEIGNHAGELHAALLAEGMVVRDYPESSPLGAYLRFTARSREANRRLLTRIAHHMS